jgi:phage FluMu protein Com
MVKKLETSTPKIETELKEEPKVKVVEKDIRCDYCSLLLAKIVSPEWEIQIKCRRCGNLQTYRSAKKTEKVLVREEAAPEVVEKETKEEAVS